MADHNSQPKKNSSDSNRIRKPTLMPSFTTGTDSQQQQAIHADNNNNIEVQSSEAISMVHSDSSSSMGSTSSDVRREDKLFDQIEDIISDYMRTSDRYYLHCRVLRLHVDDDLSRQFSAIVIINPPFTKP